LPVKPIDVKRKGGFLNILLLVMPVTAVFPQEIVTPNQALKSHETLIIQKIETDASNTIIYMQVENRRQGGNFCADREIYIQYPDGTRMKMIRSRGIPVCPAIHKFKSVGERLDFSLVFPPLRKGLEWFDLVEDCQENCFWFYGITLESELNRRLDELFRAAEKGTPEQNIKSFRSLLEEIDDKNHGIEGLLYINIINAALESGDRVEAAVWYNRLKSSGAPRSEQYMKYLNDKGIKF
jgi:hypothetical protein